MQNDAAIALEPELLFNERLLWSGAPRRGIVFRPYDFFFIPFSLVWGGFALLWETFALLGGAPFPFALFGVPFVLVGFYMIFGRFIVDSYVRSRTYYAVTNERAIIVSGLFNRTTSSIWFRTFPDTSVEQSANGSGSITFGQATVSTRARNNPVGFGGGVASNRFDALPNVNEAISAIREAQRAFMQPPPANDAETRNFR